MYLFKQGKRVFNILSMYINVHKQKTSLTVLEKNSYNYLLMIKYIIYSEISWYKRSLNAML